MTMMSSLPRDLAEEILSRVPLKSLRRVRLTCKTWNTLSKDVSFQKKQLGKANVAGAKEKEFLVVLMMEFRVYLMRVNLHKNVVESSDRIKRESQVTSLEDSDQIDVSEVFHCDGLLLCVMEDTRLVVWNPYLGQTRWIKPMHKLRISEMNKHAIGYEKSSKKSCRNYKILSFIVNLVFFSTASEYKLYDFNSDSLMVLDDVTGNENMTTSFNNCVSVEGNTYWIATEFNRNAFLLCFDFTKERFAPRLPLPFQSNWLDTVALSSVREEQLAVLFQRGRTLDMEIWVTNKIEPNAVSWRSKLFLALNMRSLACVPVRFNCKSFFIDEEKKDAVIFGQMTMSCASTRNVAYIVGMDGSLEEINLRVSANEYCYPLVCSYVPSLVQLSNSPYI